jgi:hypothetical protein
MSGFREVGRATSADGLMVWPDEKLVSEVRKQIRCDVGGQDMHAHCRSLVCNVLANVSVPQEVVDRLAYIVARFGKDATEGSRRRVESKLVEISARLGVRGSVICRLEGQVDKLSKELEVLKGGDGGCGCVG